MSDLSNYAEDALVDHLLGTSAFTMPTNCYLALYTAISDAEAGTGTECVASGYARQLVAFGASSGGAASNSAIETFGPLSGTGTITHAGLNDTVTSGNPLTALKALTASKAWTDGDSIQFAVGDIDFDLA